MTGHGLVHPERRALATGWSMRSTAPGACADPEALRRECARAGGWDLEEVTIPCTVASALRAAGRLDLADPASVDAVGDLDQRDHWFVHAFEAGAEQSILVFEGLATLAEVWLNGERLLESDDMFRSYRVPIAPRRGERNELALCFRSLGPFLSTRRPRARWRTALVSERNLRFLRTTLFGRMPSWCPPLPPVGPWRPIALMSGPAEGLVLEQIAVRPRLEGGRGHLSLEASLRRDGAVEGASDGSRFFLEVDGESHPLHVEEQDAFHSKLRGELVLDDVEPWWPHTHLSAGERPRRYSLALVCDQERLELEPVGFRAIERTPGPRFALRVNGEAIFCRGTCWTPVDALALRSDEAALRRALEQTVAAGVNMLRVTGTVVYEQEAFYRLCDELGILVWQDFMFATFDYPTDDDAFRATAEAEVEEALDRLEGRACLAVLCGSSEGFQQPAMLGLSDEDRRSRFFDEWLPERCASRRPDVPYWPSTPSGGELPFHLDEGTSHYFGVGGYRRSLDDVRLARPTFATECLAFANLPGDLGPDTTRQERVPRDRGADWDFLDVTRHYRDELLPVGASGAPDAAEEAGQGAESLRATEAGQDAESLRATSALVMESVQSVLRGRESDCGGALVLNHRDPWPCAGWGVIDAAGRPKSAWYGLARAWAPLCVSILDEGLDGLRVRVLNDRPLAIDGRLELSLQRLDGTTIAAESRSWQAPARGEVSMSVDRFLGGFIDSSHAYRFGPRSFDVAVARFIPDEPAGALDPVGLEAIHLPRELGRLAPTALGLRAEWTQLAGGAGCESALSIETDAFAQTVIVEVEGGVCQDNFFHLAPGRARRLAVWPVAEASIGRVRLRALNARETLALEPPGGRG